MDLHVGWRVRLALGALLLGLATAIWCAAQPPRARGIDAAPAEFSGQRALAYSRKFAIEPRPRGGHAAARGRDYIDHALRDYGVEVEIHRTPINHGMSVTFVENVLGRIKGTDSTQTFGVTAHYDSVAWGPGAADDGAGVVVMLEAARALKCGPPLKHDVVFVFTGDEEGGGNGSVNSLKHPWLANLNVMLGLEGRGAWGTGYMFETSKGNLPLLRELAKSGAPAISNSIMYEVHRQTPNTTDFTHMANNGALGYNVAFVGGLGYYHTANDKPEHLSPHTLQHQGEYVLALVRHYDSGGPKIEKGEDAIFFNTFGKHLVVYPASMGKWVAIAAYVVMLLALGVAIYTRALSFAGVALGLALMVFSVTIMAAIGTGLQVLSYKLFYVYIMYNAIYYHLSFLLLGLGVAAALFALFRRWLTPESLQAAVLLLWAVVLAVLEKYLTQGSYVAAWSLMFGAVALGVACLLRRGGVPAWLIALVQIAGALPTMAFSIPGWQAGYHMGGALTPVPTAVVAMLVVFALMPVLVLVVGNGAKRIAQVCAVLALVVFLWGWAAQRFSADKPRMNALTYAVNLDGNEAIWLTSDKEPDEWVSQFLPKDKATTGDVSKVLPTKRDPLLHAPAPVARLEPSAVEVVADTTEGNVRKVTLKYSWTRSINETRFEVLSPAKVVAASVDGPGDVLADMSGWSLNVGYLPHDGQMTLRLSLDASTPGPVQLRMVEETYSLPELTQLGYRPRPEWMIPKANTLDWWEGNRINSEYTFVTKTYSI